MYPGPCWHCGVQKKNILGRCSQCGRFPSTAALAAYQEGTANMSLETQKFARKPFVVDVVEVTAENLEEVAKWCAGKIHTKKQKGEFTELVYDVKFIKVKVNRALNQRQTEAYIGDFVLKAGTGFKIYTPQAFAKSFEPVLEEDEGHETDDGLDSFVTLLGEIEAGNVTPAEVREALDDVVREVLVEGEPALHGAHPSVPQFVAAIEKGDAPDV